MSRILLDYEDTEYEDEVKWSKLGDEACQNGSNTEILYTPLEDFPVKTRRGVISVKDQPSCEIIYSEYANRLLLIITQTDDVSLVTQTLFSDPHIPTAIPRLAIKTTVLMGESKYAELCASRIAEMIVAHRGMEKRPLITMMSLERSKALQSDDICSSINSSDRLLLRAIVQGCTELSVW